jgi:membrane protein implicated in regulation of membrane protease activity
LTISLVSSIFISVLVTGFAVYGALTKFSAPDVVARWFASGGEVSGSQRQGAGEAVRVLFALFSAISVAVAESFLYFTYLGKVERARAKERGKKEKKIFVGRVGEEDGDTEEVVGEVSVGGEKEEIWGKGVNGGVRRRVREKWEKERDGLSEEL